jgi:hypothetical protein
MTSSFLLRHSKIQLHISTTYMSEPLRGQRKQGRLALFVSILGAAVGKNCGRDVHALFYLAYTIVQCPMWPKQLC